MEDALNWLRSKGLDLDDDDTAIESFDKLGVVPMGLRSMYEKDRDLKNAFDWISNSGENDESNNAFSKLDSLLPTREGKTKKDRAKDIGNALGWLRANGVSLCDDDDGIPSFQNFTPERIVHKSPEEREKDVGKALDWLRQGKGDDSDMSNTFNKIEVFLPSTETGQSDLSRAEEIENALNWLRTNGVNFDDVDEEFISSSKVGSVSNTRRSTQAPSSEDVKDVLNWLRDSSQNDSLDPSGRFKKLEASMPLKKDQSLEERAQEIAKALDWTREEGFTPETKSEDENVTNQSLTGPVFNRTPEQRSQDLSDALHWLRHENTDGKDFDPTGDFCKLNNILPRKADQSLEDRAKCIEEGLDWIRGHESVEDGDDFELPHFLRVPPTGISNSTPEQRLRDLSNAIEWIKNGKGRNMKDDSSGDFQKLDKLLPKKRGQTAEERGRAIEGTLDFLRSNNVSLDDDDDIVDKYSELGSIPVALRTPEQRNKDLHDVLNWILHQGENDAINDPNGYFRKLDDLLPKRRGEKVKDRAMQIEKFLDCVRGSEISFPDGSTQLFDEIKSVSRIYRTPEQRTEDLEKITNWLRRKGKKDKKYDPGGHFRKLDKLLPTKKNQSLEDRARVLEGALDYIRHSGISLGDDRVFEQLSKLGAIPMSRFTPEQRFKDQQDVLDWLRFKGNRNEFADPTGDYEKLSLMLPKKSGQRLEDRAKDIEMALDWVRHKSLGGTDYLLGADEVVVEPSQRKIDKRSEDLANILNWLGNKGEYDDKYDPSGEFRKLDRLLPRKRGQSSEDRAQEIEGALDWMREKDVPLLSNDRGPEHYVSSTIPFSQRTIEQRSEDLQKVLHWLKHIGEDDDTNDPNEVFRKLNGMLPVKAEQSIDERAHEIERALDWCRNRYHDPLSEGGIPDFSKVDSIPTSRRTPEERLSNVKDIVSWLRSNAIDDTDVDLSADFRKLNNLLPRSPGQTLEERAHDIEGVFDYIRNHNISANDDALTALSKSGKLPISRRSPEERMKDTSDILAWMRQKKAASLDPLGHYKKLDDLLPMKEGQRSKDRARDIESTLDWCCSVGLRPSDVELNPNFDEVNSVPLFVRTPEERKVEYDDIIFFLRNKSGGMDSKNEFARLDQMLLSNEGQSLEERARIMERTMDWIRISGLKLDEEDLPMPAFDKIYSVPVRFRNTNERERDLRNVLNWIRKGKSMSDDPTGEFTKIEEMLPYEQGEKPRDRARKIESALDWIQNKGILSFPVSSNQEDQLDPYKSNGITATSPDQVENILAWIQTGKNNYIQDFETYRNVDQMLPKRRGESSKERAENLTKAVEWFKTNEKTPTENAMNEYFKKHPSIQIPTREPEQRTKDLVDVLKWLRNKNDVHHPKHQTFKKIDDILPKRNGETLRERAKKIENALDYYQKPQDENPSIETSTAPFNRTQPLNTAFTPSTSQSPEDRLTDVDDIVSWIRSGKPDDVEGGNADGFKAIDQTLPAKRRQSPEDRARDIESVLDYCRSVGMDPSEFDGSVGPFSKAGSLPISSKSPEDRLTDVDDIVSWIRSGKPDDEGGNADGFKAIDQTLPAKRRQSPEDRARDIESECDPSEFDGSVGPFSKAGSLPISSKSPEDRLTDVDDIVSWIRSGKPDDEGGNADGFKAIDQTLPARGGNPQKTELVTLRVEFDGSVGPFSKAGSLPISSKSPEDRLTDVDDIASWIRSGKPDDEGGGNHQKTELVTLRVFWITAGV
eukprot:jgi/Psemu1/59493/gm1.59493_g